MIHPSYVELMKVVNEDVVIGEEPVVNSRYSIVLAAAKRARQIVNGQPTNIENPKFSAKKWLNLPIFIYPTLSAIPHVQNPPSLIFP